MIKLFKEKNKEEKKSFKISKSKTLYVRVFSVIASLLFATSSILVLESLLSMGILPPKYFWLIAGSMIVLAIVGILMFFIAKKHKITVIIFGVVYILLSAAMCWGCGYLYNTRQFFSNTGAKDYYIVSYSVFVRNESEYNRLEDVDGKKLANYVDMLDSYNDAFEQMKEIIGFETLIKDNYVDAARAVLDGEADFVLLSESYAAIIEDYEEDFSKKVRDICDFEIKIYETVDVIDVDVVNEPFNILISGIDTLGDISEVSRSDVNMIISINPKKNKILLTSIPRDYYVQLHGTTGAKDKLTHSGIYGPKMTVKTIEDLLDITINYFVRVNFNSVIKLVDAIGGVYITPDITLHRNQMEITCYYYTGVRILYDGPCAVRYARERKAYPDGDLHRIKNQQQVMNAILDRVVSPEIIKNYSNILSAIEGDFETSIPEKKIYQMINYQLDNMPKWNIENSYLDGTDKYSDIFSSDREGAGNNGSSYYVMEPNPESVKAAKAKIDALFEE